MKQIFLLLISVFVMPIASLAAGTKVVLATFEAPPFFSAGMPDQGAAAYAMKKMFKDVGYDLTFKILPIRRALAETLRNADVDGYVPASEYDKLEGLTLSKTAYRTQTLLLQNRERPVDWTDAKKISKFRGGNVRGYVLKGPMRALEEAGKLKMEESPNDVLNIVKLGENRLDYVLIADSMYHFLMMSEPRLAPYTSKIEANRKPVTEVLWGIAFKSDLPRIQKILKDFNATVDKEKFRKYLGEYMTKQMKNRVKK